MCNSSKVLTNPYRIKEHNIPPIMLCPSGTEVLATPYCIQFLLLSLVCTLPLLSLPSHTTKTVLNATVQFLLKPHHSFSDHFVSRHFTCLCILENFTKSFSRHFL